MNTSGEEKRNFTPSINKKKVLFTKAITPEQKKGNHRFITCLINCPQFFYEEARETVTNN